MEKISNFGEMKSGYYWYSFDGEHYEVVEVDKETDGSYCVWFIGSELEEPLTSVGGDFYGPITPPNK